MHRIWALTALAIAPLLAGLGPAHSEDLRSVGDPGHRFTISIPVTWRVRTSHGDPAVLALSPAPPGEMADSLEVIARDLPAPISPEACVQRVARLMRWWIRDFTTLDKGPSEIGGLEAYSHSYSWSTRAGVGRLSHQVCVTVGRRAFVLIGSTTNTPEHIADNLPALDRLMDTFRPLPDAARAGPQRSWPPLR
jgi:hypothetical protein